MDMSINNIYDDDEDALQFIEHINRPRREKKIRPRPNHMDQWDNHDFIARFRMSKPSVHTILNYIGPTITSPTTRNNALSPVLKVLLTLRFYATGSFLVVVGYFCGIHKSTASKAIWQVTQAIAELGHHFIKMPENSDEIKMVQQKFYNIARFPRCIGAVDCTHIRIQSPGGYMAETYRNRKNFFSINMQTICDTDLKILNIVARWPGATHDSTIFKNSKICHKFEYGEMADNLIVADSGYAIRKYLITPLTNPVTPAEILFKESLTRTRNPVERSYGVWKRRFPVLSLGIRLKRQKLEGVIVATAVLHNIARNLKDLEPPCSEDIEEAVALTNNIECTDNSEKCTIQNITRKSLISKITYLL